MIINFNPFCMGSSREGISTKRHYPELRSPHDSVCAPVEKQYQNGHPESYIVGAQEGFLLLCLLASKNFY